VPINQQPAGSVQTIQLAAARNPQGADDLWQQLSETQPELQALNPVIIPATVRSVQVYRLRASGQEAFAICSRLVARGVACIKVST
jgi:acetyl-CoA acetyltransferase